LLIVNIISFCVIPRRSSLQRILGDGADAPLDEVNGTTVDPEFAALLGDLFRLDVFFPSSTVSKAAEFHCPTILGYAWTFFSINPRTTAFYFFFRLALQQHGGPVANSDSLGRGPTSPIDAYARRNVVIFSWWPRSPSVTRSFGVLITEPTDQRPTKPRTMSSPQEMSLVLFFCPYPPRVRPIISYNPCFRAAAFSPFCYPFRWAPSIDTTFPLLFSGYPVDSTDPSST